jgi:hypothetical protein
MDNNPNDRALITGKLLDVNSNSVGAVQKKYKKAWLIRMRVILYFRTISEY